MPSRDNTDLWSLTPDGQTNWSAIPYGRWHMPPAPPAAIGSDGTIYYFNSNAVWALSQTAEVKWVCAFSNGRGAIPFIPTTVPPVIGPDGTVYALYAGLLYAIAGNSATGPDSPWPMYGQNARHTGKVEKPSLHHPQTRSDKAFQFQVMSQIGQPFKVQTSTNLLKWLDFTNIISTSVPMDVVDESASNAPTKFYRVLAP